MSNYFELTEEIKTSLGSADKSYLFRQLSTPDMEVFQENCKWASHKAKTAFQLGACIENVDLPNPLIFSELDKLFFAHDFILKTKFTYFGEYGMGYIWRLYQYGEGEVLSTHYPTNRPFPWFVDNEGFGNITDALTALCRRYGKATPIMPVVKHILEEVITGISYDDSDLAKAENTFGPGRARWAIDYLHREGYIRATAFQTYIITDEGKRVLFDPNNLF